MFGPKSLEFPSPLKLVGRIVRSSFFLLVIGGTAAVAVGALQGHLCDLIGSQTQWSEFACSAQYSTHRLTSAMLTMSLYLAYLLAGPVLHGHNRIVVHSHDTAWVHAVSNWVSRLTGGINPMTPGFSDVVSAATNANHSYYKHNIVTFLVIFLGTVLYALAIFTPWVVIDGYLPGPYTTTMVWLLTVIYIFVATMFLWLGIKVLSQIRHRHDEDDD